METIRGVPIEVLGEFLRKGDFFFYNKGEGPKINCKISCEYCPWNSGLYSDCIVGPKEINDRILEYFPEFLL